MTQPKDRFVHPHIVGYQSARKPSPLAREAQAPRRRAKLAPVAARVTSASGARPSLQGGYRQTFALDRAARAPRALAAFDWMRAARPLEDGDFRDGPSQRRHHGALCHRSTDERRNLSSLAPTSADPRSRQRRCRRDGQFAAHKIANARKTLYSAGMRLRYLPPYSPDLNPIEMAFAKLKAPMRKAAPGTVDRLWDKIGEILARFSPEERANYPRHSGYA